MADEKQVAQVDLPSAFERITVEDVTQLSLVLIEHVESMIARADEKAQVILTAATLLAAALTFSERETLTTLNLRQLTTGDVLGLLFNVLLLVMLLLAVLYAVLAAVPILVVGSSEKKRQSAPVAANLFYFGDIAAMGRDTFVEAFASQSEAAAREAILEQIYAKSVIAERKFGRIKQGTRYLLIAIILWAGGELLI